MKPVKRIGLAVSCLAIIIFFSCLCMGDLFGDVGLEQMLWHLKNAELLARGHTDELKILRYGLTILLYVSLCCALFLYDRKIAAGLRAALGSLTHRSVPLSGILRALRVAEICLSAAALVYLGHFAPEVWQMAKTQFWPESVEDSTFIADNYEVPPLSAISFPDGRNNLVILLVESLEDTFRAYIPRLEALRAEGVSTTNMRAAHGITWTIAAQTAWHFGLPLKNPLGIKRNHYISKNGFLPNAVSIFDILAANGYRCVLIMGTEAVFGGTDLLFTRHGGFEVRDKSYFDARGHDRPANQGTEWGYSDSFVLARAFDAYRELLEQGRPFALLVATIDTHSPTGWAPPEEREFGDIRDAIRAADKNVSAFARKLLALPQGHDRLALCVIGDHEYMGKPDFLKDGRERRLYNFFAGNIPAVPEEKRDAPLTALDIAPTLLQMAGARWGSDRFGLGVSLFSPAPGLARKLGKEKLDEALAGRSRFYEQFY